MAYSQRRKKLSKLLQSADAILVTGEANVRYLTGFTGDSTFLLQLRNGDSLLMSDPRYEEQLAEQCPDVAVFIRKPSESLIPVTAKQVAKLDVGSLVIESQSMNVATFDQFAALCEAQLRKSSGLVEQLRMLKDQSEIQTIERAVEIAQRAFLSVRPQLRREHTEIEIAHEIERVMRSMGATGCSFDPIVAAGSRAALPHAVPDSRQFGDSHHILFDWGATYDGYRSDITRVLVDRRAPAKLVRAYEAVHEAQLAAIAALKPGVALAEIDAITRDCLAAARLEKRFTHGLGHGIGLDIHEAPRLGKSAEGVLRAGMVITIEPGVYFPGFGGIRIEDDVLITKDGHRVLTSLPKEIELNSLEFAA